MKIFHRLKEGGEYLGVFNLLWLKRNIVNDKFTHRMFFLRLPFKFIKKVFKFKPYFEPYNRELISIIEYPTLVIGIGVFAYNKKIKLDTECCWLWEPCFI